MYLSSTIMKPLTLTPREAEVLRLLCVGYSDKAIGQALTISARTVGVHLQAVYKKLGVNQNQGNTRGVAQGKAMAEGLVRVYVGQGDRRTGRDGSRRLTPRGYVPVSATR